jgi:hypothetical protein
MKQDMTSDASAPAADCPPKPLGDVIAINEGVPHFFHVVFCSKLRP